MKKKLFSLVLALALCMGLTVPVSAESAASVAWLDEGFDVGDYTVRENLLPVRDANWKYGFVDTTGKLAIPLKFDDAGEFSEGLAKVQDRSGEFLWGYTDKTGKLVIPYRYVFAYPFCEGLAAVATNIEDENGMRKLKWGFIDKTGKVVIPFQFDQVVGFSEGLAAVKRGNRWGYIDATGKEVIPFTFYYAQSFVNGMAAVMSTMNPRTWAYIDKTGEFAITPHLLCFDVSAFYYGADLAVVRTGDNSIYGSRFINKYGMFAFRQSYEDAAPFSEGYAAVQKNGNWGFIDEKGNVVIPLEYLSASLFVDGLAAVKKDGKAGYINKDGEVIIPMEYDEAYGFKNGYTVVKKDGRYGILTLSNVSTTSPVVGGFTDVKSSDYYADAVLWAVEKKITSGTSATTFSPGATCSKAQILTFLWRANGSPEPTAANPFTDIKPADYFYKAALWASEKGLVSGSTFGANTDCTRAMTVEYLWKVAGSPTPSAKASFTDVPANADYAQAVAWAVENKITSGTGGGNFSPAATCTRGQIVTFLYRAMGK